MQPLSPPTIRCALALAIATAVGPSAICAGAPPPIGPALCAQGELQILDCRPVDPRTLPRFRALMERAEDGRYPRKSLAILQRQLAGLLIEARFPAPKPARCFANQSLDQDVRSFAEKNRYFLAGAREIGCDGLADLLESGRWFYAKPQRCDEVESACCLVGAIELRLPVRPPG